MNRKMNNENNLPNTESDNRVVTVRLPTELVDAVDGLVDAINIKCKTEICRTDFVVSSLRNFISSLLGGIENEEQALDVISKLMAGHPRWRAREKKKNQSDSANTSSSSE